MKGRVFNLGGEMNQFFPEKRRGPETQFAIASRKGKNTEEVGFEPTIGCPIAVFKTAAIGHSATLP